MIDNREIVYTYPGKYDPQFHISKKMLILGAEILAAPDRQNEPNEKKAMAVYLAMELLRRAEAKAAGER